jgi:hypothetical protein
VVDPSVGVGSVVVPSVVESLGAVGSVEVNPSGVVATDTLSPVGPLDMEASGLGGADVESLGVNVSLGAVGAGAVGSPLCGEVSVAVAVGDTAPVGGLVGVAVGDSVAVGIVPGWSALTMSTICLVYASSWGAISPNGTVPASMRSA